MAYRCKTHESKECDGCGECQNSGRTLRKYGVTITLEPIEVVAENEEEAKLLAKSTYLDISAMEMAIEIADFEVEELNEEEE